eukprot:6107345-Amphidinium_carterae.1
MLESLVGGSGPVEANACDNAPWAPEDVGLVSSTRKENKHESTGTPSQLPCGRPLLFSTVLDATVSAVYPSHQQSRYSVKAYNLQSVIF